jgi:hypothetical protein
LRALAKQLSNLGDGADESEAVPETEVASAGAGAGMFGSLWMTNAGRPLHY